MRKKRFYFFSLLCFILPCGLAFVGCGDEPIIPGEKILTVEEVKDIFNTDVFQHWTGVVQEKINLNTNNRSSLIVFEKGDDKIKYFQDTSYDKVFCDGVKEYWYINSRPDYPIEYDESAAQARLNNLFNVKSAECSISEVLNSTTFDSIKKNTDENGNFDVELKFNNDIGGGSNVSLVYNFNKNKQLLSFEEAVQNELFNEKFIVKNLALGYTINDNVYYKVNQPEWFNENDFNFEIKTLQDLERQLFAQKIYTFYIKELVDELNGKSGQIEINNVEICLDETNIEFDEIAGNIVLVRFDYVGEYQVKIAYTDNTIQNNINVKFDVKYK